MSSLPSLSTIDAPMLTHPSLNIDYDDMKSSNLSNLPRSENLIDDYEFEEKLTSSSSVNILQTEDAVKILGNSSPNPISSPISEKKEDVPPENYYENTLIESNELKTSYFMPTSFFSSNLSDKEESAILTMESVEICQFIDKGPSFNTDNKISPDGKIINPDTNSSFNLPEPLHPSADDINPPSRKNQSLSVLESSDDLPDLGYSQLRSDSIQPLSDQLPLPSLGNSQMHSRFSPFQATSNYYTKKDSEYVINHNNLSLVSSLISQISEKKLEVDKIPEKYVSLTFDDDNAKCSSNNSNNQVISDNKAQNNGLDAKLNEREHIFGHSVFPTYHLTPTKVSLRDQMIVLSSNMPPLDSEVDIRTDEGTYGSMISNQGNYNSSDFREFTNEGNEVVIPSLVAASETVEGNEVVIPSLVAASEIVEGNEVVIPSLVAASETVVKEIDHFEKDKNSGADLLPKDLYNVSENVEWIDSRSSSSLHTLPNQNESTKSIQVSPSRSEIPPNPSLVEKIDDQSIDSTGQIKSDDIYPSSSKTETKTNTETMNISNSISQSQHLAVSSLLAIKSNTFETKTFSGLTQ